MASGAVLVHTNCLGSVSPLTTGGSCYRWSQQNCAKNCQLKKLRRETMPDLLVRHGSNQQVCGTSGGQREPLKVHYYLLRRKRHVVFECIFKDGTQASGVLKRHLQRA